MKIHLSSVLISFLFLPFCFSGCTTGTRKPPIEEGALIVSVKGPVELKRADGRVANLVAPMEDENRLFLAGDTLVTGEGGSVEILMLNGSRIRLFEKSILKGDTLDAGTDQKPFDVRLKLDSGKVFSRVSKMGKNQNYRITSPTGVAMVRGTEFLVEEKDGSMMTKVKEGSVAVTDPGRSREEIVESGRVASLKDGDFSIRDLSESELQDFPPPSEEIEKIRGRVQEEMEMIRESYDRRKKEVRDALESQRESSRELLENRKEVDREILERTRSDARKQIEQVRQKTRRERDDIRISGKSEMDELKSSAEEQSDKIRASAGDEKEKAKSAIELIKEKSAPSSAQSKDSSQ